jgi:hypothetical protein|uniref:Uncharacterized protein n=1 Tax=Zea mays TaxID=4577 RepID=B4FKL0_MAIZE|nr:unknown [Zea mays]
MIENQSYHLVVVVIEIAMREHTVMRKEASMGKMIGTEGIGNMMTTTVTVDPVTEALVETMIVIIASATTEAEVGRKRRATDEGISLMVSGTIETMATIAAGEMKTATGKGAQIVNIEEKTEGTM